MCYQTSMTQRPADVPPIDEWTALLLGKVAVITGGGDGIGAAIATMFAQHGATVEIAEIDEERARRTVDSIRRSGGEAHGHVVDVRLAEDVARLRDEVVGRHGGIDVLVNNVGDYRPLVRFERSDAESWQAMYDINLRHLFSVTRAFLGPMIDRGGGSIVNIHSVEGTRGFPGEPVYAAMKAGASHFTQSLAAGYGRKGIRCNGIGPDLIQTPQVDYLAGHDDHDERWESWAPVVASAGPTTWPVSPCFSPVTCPPSSPATTSRSTAAPSPSPAGSTARKPGGSSTGPSSCRRPQPGLRRYSTAD